MTIAQISSSTPLHRPKWHLIYFALAALNLLTIGAALYLSYGLRAIYAESVRVNQVLNDRLARYNELETIAGAVDAPGNDVFVSHDAAGESARLQAALAQFDWKLEGERREIERSLPPMAARPYLQRFDAVEAALREMTAQAGKIFTDFGNNNPGRAAEHMAAMDQAFASLHVALEAMQDDVREAQKRHLLEQAALAESLKKYEWSLAAMILLLVAGVALYGRRLTRGVNEAYEMQRRAHDTELIHVQENHRMLASVVAQTDDAVTITDPDGVIEYVNPAFERMTGYSRSEVLGRKPSLSSPTGMTRRSTSASGGPSWAEHRSAKFSPTAARTARYIMNRKPSRHSRINMERSSVWSRPGRTSPSTGWRRNRCSVWHTCWKNR